MARYVVDWSTEVYNMKASLFLIVLMGSALTGQNPSLQLDGTDDYVDVPHSSAITISGYMTVEAWIKIDAYPTHPAEIVNKKQRNPWKGFWFHLQNGAIEFGYFKGLGTGTYDQASGSWNAITLGQWAHVAGVVRSDAVDLYVNGGLIASSPTSVGVAGSTANPLRFGSDSEAPAHNPNSDVEGLIDEVRLWSIERTVSEIQSTMHFPVDGLPGLVGCWHLDGNALDSTGGHHGALVGNATYSTASSWWTPCGGPTTCMMGNVPAPLGGTLFLSFSAPAPNAPVFVLADVATGSVSLGSWGTSQIAFSPALIALADPVGILGPSIGPTSMNAFGAWTLNLPLPPDPMLAALTFYVEGYALNFLAPNGFFHQSNLLQVTFQ